MIDINSDTSADNDLRMKNVFLSIIIPVYNVQSYLQECLDSLISDVDKSLLDRVEVIIVDDGSEDSSWHIIESYTNNYPCIKSFKKINGGLSDARNFGLDKATGYYVSFIDSDDCVHKDFIQNIIFIAKKYDFDLLSFDYEKFYECLEPDRKTKRADPKIHKVDTSFYTSQSVFAWNKIYKRELFSNMRFEKGLYYEDVALIPLIIEKADNLMHMDWKCYFYRQRKGAITFYQDNRYLDILSGVKYIYTQSKSNFIKNIIINQFFTLCLISLRLPLSQCVKNINKITDFYNHQFPLQEMVPKFKVKHIPFSVFKLIGAKSFVLFLVMFKPLVILHNGLKKFRGSK